MPGTRANSPEMQTQARESDVVSLTVVIQIDESNTTSRSLFRPQLSPCAESLDDFRYELGDPF